MIQGMKKGVPTMALTSLLALGITSCDGTPSWLEKDPQESRNIDYSYWLEQNQETGSGTASPDHDIDQTEVHELFDQWISAIHAADGDRLHEITTADFQAEHLYTESDVFVQDPDTASEWLNQELDGWRSMELQLFTIHREQQTITLSHEAPSSHLSGYMHLRELEMIETEHELKINNVIDTVIKSPQTDG